MAKSYGYEGETWESLQLQLEYCDLQLSMQLADWERKEYEGVKEDLLFKLSHKED